MSLALAKRAGANAVVVSQDILERVADAAGPADPADMRVDVTRDYGQTANDKANELLFHLGLGDRFHRGADRPGDRLARGGGDAGGDPHDDPADAVLRPG